MSQDLLKDSQDLEHGRLVDVSTHSPMSPVFLDELEVDALSQDLLEDTEIPIWSNALNALTYARFCIRL